MLQRKKKIAEIPAEKMGLLAEKGLNKARLSRDELLTLAKRGLAELYNIKEYIKTPTTPLDPQIIKNVMAAYFPETENNVPKNTVIDISILLTNTVLKVIKNSFDWQPDSPVFAQRGDESDSISFFKDTGKFTVHIEISKGSEMRPYINVRLTDKSNLEHSSFEATLFQNCQCVESIHVTKNPVASFSSVVGGDYVLKVSDRKGEIVSVNIALKYF